MFQFQSIGLAGIIQRPVIPHRKRRRMKEPTITVIVASRLKELIQAEDPEFRMNADVPEALNTLVTRIIREAIARARTNKRKTVYPGDL
jgi:histone H3/H4